MDTISDDAVAKAAAPGIAKAKAEFEAVAQEMVGRSADEIHQELVKRLEAQKFAWDDGGLQAIAAKLAESDGAQETSSDEQPDRPATDSDEGPGEADKSASKND